MWDYEQACKFELTKFSQNSTQICGVYLADMQARSNQIFTLKILLKFVGLFDKHASLVKPYIDTQYSTNYFSMRWSNILTFPLLIQQLILNSNNIK